MHRKKYTVLHKRLGWPLFVASGPRRRCLDGWGEILGRRLESAAEISNRDWFRLLQAARAVSQGRRAAPRPFAEWVEQCRRTREAFSSVVESLHEEEDYTESDVEPSPKLIEMFATKVRI